MISGIAIMSIWQQIASGNVSSDSTAASAASAKSRPRGTESTFQSMSCVPSAASHARRNPRPRASIDASSDSSAAEHV